jgi:hypothetical protein
MVAITDSFALILFVSQSYSKGGGLVLAEGKKKFIGSVKSEHRGIVNGSDVTTFAFVLSSSVARSNGVDGAEFLTENIRNENSTKFSTGIKTESKGVMGTLWLDFESVVVLCEERMLRNVKKRNSRVILLRIRRGVIVVSAEVTNIGREFGKRKIIHAFIKTTVISILDKTCVVVNPDDVLVRTRAVAKKSPFSSIGEQFLFGIGISSLYPDTAAKSAEMGEVILRTGGNFLGGLCGTFAGKC